MADFCLQCTLELGAAAWQNDFVDCTSRSAYLIDPANAVRVICEGCGMIQVDPDGACLSDCDKHHVPAI